MKASGRSRPNPWFEISAKDYEGHMGDAAVAQLQFLENVFSDAISRYDPAAIALLGCATGNGLTHVDNRVTRRVTAVDIHPGYLEVLRNRYEKSIAGLEIIENDLALCELPVQTYTLVFAGLIFEYLAPGPLLVKIARSLQPAGVLVSVLQLPADQVDTVSKTRYTRLQRLASIMRLVPPDELAAAARRAGLHPIEGRRVVLPSGKPFQIDVFRK